MPTLYVVFPWRYRVSGPGERKDRLQISPYAECCESFEAATEIASLLFRDGKEELSLVLKFPAYGRPGLICLIGMLSADIAQNRWRLAEKLEAVEQLACRWVEDRSAVAVSPREEE